MSKKREPAEDAQNSDAERAAETEKKWKPTDDALFKEFMNEPKFAATWLEDYMPEVCAELNLSKLKLENSEFHDQLLRPRFADVIYSVPFRNMANYANLVFILEHKGQSARKDLRIALAQTVAYTGLHCLDQARRTSARKIIPEPIPILVYTGSKANLQPPRWRDFFPPAPGTRGIWPEFEIPFFNMTSLRLEGRLPRDPLLEIMYDLMTRSRREEFLGLEKTAFKPLRRLQGNWSEETVDRVRKLVVYYASRSNRRGVRVGDAEYGAIVRSLEEEGDMSAASSFYNYFEARAEARGIKNGIVIGEKNGIAIGEKRGIEIGEKRGIEIGEKNGIAIGEKRGIEIGEKNGIEQERAHTLRLHRDKILAVIRERFGEYPETLTRALDKIDDVAALIDLSYFVAMKAESIADILRYARAVLR